VITFVQCALIAGALCGGGLAFDLFPKGNNVGGIASTVFAFVGLAGVVALELFVVRG
jgi:hypothetical protein